MAAPGHGQDVQCLVQLFDGEFAGVDITAFEDDLADGLSFT